MTKQVAVTSHAKKILRAHPAVVAFSEFLRPKLRKGKPTGHPAIRAYVEKKLPRAKVPKNLLVPARIDGIPVDVVAMGTIALQRMRPLQGGISTANTHAAGGGTLGYFLRDTAPPPPPAAAAALGTPIPNKPHWYILSCAHVLNNPAGPETIQPTGGKSPGDWVGAETLYTFAGVDAAIAKIDVGATATIVGLPSPRGTGKAREGVTVAKAGATTGVTYGTVVEDSVELKGRHKGFRGCIIVENPNWPFSMPGDSGSLLIDPVSELAIGMIFAGRDLPGHMTMGIACPIDAVLRAFPNQILVMPGESYP